MTLPALFSISVTAVVFLALALTKMSTDVVMVAGLAVLLLTGVLTPADALQGFSNEGVATVAFLFIVAAGVRETGLSTIWVQWMLGKTRSVRGAQLRLMLPTSFVSAFLNNTPVVALLMPVIHDWARRHDLSPSKFLIPLSYASILGGLCTLIGTSTNLIVNGLMIGEGFEPQHMFEISKLGIPCAIAGLLFIALAGVKLLPDRRSAASNLTAAREYTLEMVVEPDGGLVGKTIEQAGLRHLVGAYLIEIGRNDQVITVVGPREKLQGGDQLVFVGVVESMVDLQRIPGLAPATEQVFKLDTPRPERVLVEAVVSNSCPFRGQTIRDSRFRTYYDAVVIAVSRDGQRINSKIGDIVLRAGDTLLLEAHSSFMDRRGNSRDFYLVSHVDEVSPPQYERRWLAILILVLMTTAVTWNIYTMLEASLAAAALMVFTRLCREDAARRAVDWRLLVTIASAIGIGRAMYVSGAAEWLAAGLVSVAGSHPQVALAVLYGVTVLFTELITNNAAAALMFPIAQATAVSLGVNPMPFFMVLMIAASASFSTPIGYQTNLMVYGPGGYRFSDFMRMGIPLNILIWVLAVVLAPKIWPF